MHRSSCLITITNKPPKGWLDLTSSQIIVYGALKHQHSSHRLRKRKSGLNPICICFMDSENHAFSQFLTGLFLSELNSRVAHILKSFERSNQFTVTSRNVSHYAPLHYVVSS